MGRKYTTAQAKATANYMQDKHQIRVIVPNEDAERYKKAAEAAGYASMNRFVIEAIEEKIRGNE